MNANEINDMFPDPKLSKNHDGVIDEPCQFIVFDIYCIFDQKL